jgi:RNA polymerase sigma-70 factor (ECF subfamily)
MLNNTELVALLSATADKDQRAFAQLYDLTSSYLMGLSTRMLRNQTLAEEVLQEAFINVWYKAEDFDETKGSAFAWLAAIVRHKTLDLMRKESRIGKDTLHFDEELEDFLFNLIDNPQDHFDDHKEMEQLQKCLDALEQEPRKALMMAYYYGFSHGEIVEKMTKPLGTVKSWIRRGLMSVRECLER